MASAEKFLSQIRKINNKVDLKTEFPGWNKSIQFNVVENGQGKGEVSFYFVVEGGKVSQVDKGTLNNPDVTIEGSAQAMSKLFDGSIPIVGAFITKELTIKGAVGDAVGANVLLQAARTF